MRSGRYQRQGAIQGAKGCRTVSRCDPEGAFEPQKGMAHLARRQAPQLDGSVYCVPVCIDAKLPVVAVDHLPGWHRAAHRGPVGSRCLGDVTRAAAVKTGKPNARNLPLAHRAGDSLLIADLLDQAEFLRQGGQGELRAGEQGRDRYHADDNYHHEHHREDQAAPAT